MQFDLDFAPFRPPPAAAEGKARHVVADGRIITYRLRRARRRTIGLVVGRDGLVASAPRWVPIAEVEAFIREKAAWIGARLAEQARRRRAPFAWRIGAKLPVLGREHEIVCAANATGIAHDRLAVAPAAAHSPAALRESALDVLKTHALELFVARVGHYAARLERSSPTVRISNARTRWGSCHADGRILLNWRLVHFRPEIIDYVVAHELAHLREMNHSPRFWRVVEGIYPGYHAARQELRARGDDIPDL